jgi:type IV secretory pathway VirB10-like protein
MRLLTYLLLTALLAGCGEVSYKRGGSQQDIDRAHQACRGSGDQLVACLAEHGWQKPQVDALDPLFATIEVTDNKQASQAKPSPFIELPADTPQKPVTTAVAKTPQSARATDNNKPATSNTTAVEEAPKNVASHSTANDGPDVTYSINSWWKMGAFPNQLKQDQVSCEKKLGPDYLPDYKTQTYKRAFVACMHDLGWMAIRNLK